MSTNKDYRTAKARIMVPLDGSTAAEAVLPHAVTLARATSCGLELVRVVEPQSTRWADDGPARSSDPGSIRGPEEAALAGARDYLASVCRRISEIGLEIECDVLEGDPAMMLSEHSERDHTITMIAMTSYGLSGVGRWPLGSVTVKVLCSASKPLLIVRPEDGILIPPPDSYRTILVPLDGSMLAEQALDLARNLALATEAALLVVSVLSPPDDFGLLPTGVRLPVSLSSWQDELGCNSCYMERVARELSERAPGLLVEKEVILGRPADSILALSEATHADLIVMSTHGFNTKQSSGRPHRWLGSTALKVVQGAVSPVLLVRPKEVCDLELWAESEGLRNHLDNLVRTRSGDLG